MQLLLEEADIPATVVTGFDENKRSHMWNIVTVEGRNYHLDPTWNDSSDLIRHTYFNMTSADMLLTHSLDDENFGIDTCTATAANYFTRTGAYFNTYSLEDIARVVAREVAAGAETIELRFSPDKLQKMCIRDRLLEAASISATSVTAPESIPRQISHSLQGSPSTGCRQLTALARIFAQEVFPVPRDPVNR